MEREVVDGGRGASSDGFAAEAEVARARLSFEQGLREASRVGTRAARRVVAPALIGVGLAGGALLLLALLRLARRPSDGALIRIVVETPSASKYRVPVVGLGGAALRWLLERQLRGQSPLSALLHAVASPSRGRERGGYPIESARGVGHYES